LVLFSFQTALKDYMKIIVSTSIILSLFVVIFHWKSSSLDAQYNFRRLASANQYKKNINRSSVCHNVLGLMRNAKWVKRTNLTKVEEIQQSLLEVQIRKKRGIPIILQRSDLRCGGKPFFLHSPDFGYQLPALCDADGSASCCNHVTKWCGNGLDHCNCERCTDFRKEISAELFDWIPMLNGCHFTNFTSDEACSLMSDRISRLVLIGDSLVRHLFNALMILFTDDRQRGSLILSRDHPSDNDMAETCEGAMQFVDGGSPSCHTKTLTSIPHNTQRSFCEGRNKFDFFFKEYYNIDKAPNILETVRQNLNKEKTVIAIGVGLHTDLNAREVQQKIIEPLLEIKKSSGSIWPYIIWISVHAHGSLKDTYYNVPSHNDRIARFNLDMEKYLLAFGIPVFDTFNLTRGVRSIDGTHFGIGVNMMKAQLFMNFIKETF